MKKILWACLCVIAVSCTKSSSGPQTETQPENPVNQSVKLYPVHLRIGDLEVSTGRKANKEMPASEYLRYVFYGAYDSTGRLASKIEQYNSSTIGFGVLKDSLPAGDYTVVMAGADAACYNGDGDSLINSLAIISRGYDIFYKKFTISVGERDTATTLVKLPRMTGKLELQLTDTLLAAVKYINVTVDDFAANFYPLTGTFDLWGAQNFTTNYYQQNSIVSQSNVFGSNKPHKITISADDGGSPVTHVYYYKVIDSVYIYPNKKTVLRGSLASSSTTPDPNGAISVTVDPEFEETIVQDF